MTPRSPVTRRRAPALVLGAVLTIGTLTGCQSTAPDYGAETAEQFQATVLSVTQSVADGDLSTARATLVAFDSELESAAADGSVSFARHKRIDAALDAVLADVDAAIAAQAPPPEPEVVPEPVEPTAPVTNDPDDSNEDDGEDEVDEGDDAENGNNGDNGNGNNGNKDKAPKEDKAPKTDKPGK